MHNERKGFWKETVTNFFRNISFLNGDTFNRQANTELYRRKQTLRKIEKERREKSKL